jgi:diguanylate cyclase (GGDEF)-like protein
MPSFDAILTAVKEGEIDFAANITFTEQRDQIFQFSEPTNIEYTYLYSDHFRLLKDLRRVAVPKGTIYGDLINQYYPAVKQVEYDGIEHALELYESGQVDGIVDAINQLKPLLLRGLDAQILNDQIPIKPVAVVSAKGRHIALLKDIEEVAHSAEVQKLLSEAIEKYQFDIRRQALRKAVRESKLDLNREYKVKLEPIGQYTIFNEDGSVSGLSADVVFQVCDLIMINCQLKSDSHESWSHMYGELLSGEIDILAPMTLSEARRKIMNLSDAYYHPQVILVKREGYKDQVYRNLSQLVAERIGVVRDDYFEHLLGKMLPNKDLIRFETQDQLIDSLLNGRIDYMVTSRGTFNQILRDSHALLPLVEDTLVGSVHQIDIGIGFAKNPTGALLAKFFSRAVKMIDTQTVINRYDAQPNWRATLMAEKQFSRQSFWVLLIILVSLTGIAYYLHVQSNTDNLTKLRNRRSLYRRFSRGIPPKTTLVYLDVNRFKPINDSFGHEVGDRVLKQLAEKINHLWPGKGYRIGGDEFILAGDVRGQQLIDTLSHFESFLFVDSSRDIGFTVTVAIGVSESRTGPLSLEEVMHETDIAMYRAKYRNRTIPQNPILNERTQAEAFTAQIV